MGTIVKTCQNAPLPLQSNLKTNRYEQKRKILPQERRDNHRQPRRLPHPCPRPGDALPFHPPAGHRPDGIRNSPCFISARRMKEDDNPYADKLDLPYPFPFSRPRMTMKKRAAQFMPFAALSGMAEMFEDTRRRTEQLLEK